MISTATDTRTDTYPYSTCAHPPTTHTTDAPLPHEDDCCIKSLLPTAQAVVAIPTTTAPVVTTKGPLALGSATKALLKALVFKGRSRPPRTHTPAPRHSPSSPPNPHTQP